MATRHEPMAPRVARTGGRYSAGVSVAPTPAEGAPLTELLQWADTECHALASAAGDAVTERLWRIRMALEARQRQELDPAAARTLLNRIDAIREAEADLGSLRAVLETAGGPITWRDATDRPGAASALS